LNLTLAFKSGSRYISINKGSVADARIDWKTSFISGSGSISQNGEFVGDAGSVGLITATLDNYSATVEVIPTSILTFDFELEIPEGGFVYDGTPKTPAVLIDEAAGLEEDVDYSVEYINNVNAGEATVMIVSLESGKCSGSKMLSFNIAAAPISEAAVLIENDDGEIKVTVKYNETELQPEVDYLPTVEINEDARIGLVTLTGVGNYTGSKTQSFAIDSLPATDGDGETDTDHETDTSDETDSESESQNAGETESVVETESETETETKFETETETLTETQTETETETDKAPIQGDTTETDDDGADNGGGDKGWFARNAGWVIPLGGLGIAGIGAGIYFLIVKKKYVDLISAIRKLLKKGKTDEIGKDAETDEESRDSE
jgi:hypothetical protein